MNKKRLTLEQHIELAEKMKDIYRMFYAAERVIVKNTVKSSKVNKTSYRLYRVLSSLKSQLDSEYHRLITDDQFKELGHIYYGNVITDETINT